MDQPVNADLLVKIGCAPCALPERTITSQSLGDALRRAAHPGPERSALLAAASRAAAVITQEARGSLELAVAVLERTWADWEARRTARPSEPEAPANGASVRCIDGHIKSA